jgi:hypothetical protein
MYYIQRQNFLQSSQPASWCCKNPPRGTSSQSPPERWKAKWDISGTYMKNHEDVCPMCPYVLWNRVLSGIGLRELWIGNAHPTSHSPALVGTVPLRGEVPALTWSSRKCFQWRNLGVWCFNVDLLRTMAGACLFSDLHFLCIGSFMLITPLTDIWKWWRIMNNMKNESNVKQCVVRTKRAARFILTVDVDAHETAIQPGQGL